MNRRWHLVTGEYPPSTGGIAQFTHALARALASSGVEVHVWVPANGIQEDEVIVHSLPDRFGGGSRRALAPVLTNTTGDVVLVQYAPNALGWKGANLPFCLWLRSRGRHADLRIVFHEPFFYFGMQALRRNALAAVQRLMATALLASARTVYVSSASWIPLLEHYAPRPSVQWRCLPITVGDVRVPLPAEVRRVRGSLGNSGPVVGHLSTYAGELRASLHAAIRAILERNADVRVVCIGRGSHAFAKGFRDPRVLATGELPGPEIPAHLAACDLVFAPFIEGVTTRRTSVLMSLAVGAPIVTTNGRYTEDIWRETGAVALVPAGDARALADACAKLLASPGDRGALGSRGRALYAERFSPAALLDSLEIVHDVRSAAHRSGG
jgi:glycosyltransferase involved in cell wall biosynthesis